MWRAADSSAWNCFLAAISGGAVMHGRQEAQRRSTSAGPCCAARAMQRRRPCPRVSASCATAVLALGSLTYHRALCTHWSRAGGLCVALVINLSNATATTADRGGEVHGDG
jgi:hypothetical protein